MKKLVKIVIVMCILLSTMLFNLSIADVGNFESYDSDSSSSWDSDWSSSWDSDWSSSWDSDYDRDHDRTNSNRKYRSVKINDKYDMLFWIKLFLAMVSIAFFIIFIPTIIKESKDFRRYKKDKNKMMNHYKRENDDKMIEKTNPQDLLLNDETYINSVQDILSRGNNVINNIKKMDSLFDENKFLDRVKEIFVQLQMAWTERSWEKIRN